MNKGKGRRAKKSGRKCESSEAGGIGKVCSACLVSCCWPLLAFPAALLTSDLPHPPCPGLRSLAPMLRHTRPQLHPILFIFRVAMIHGETDRQTDRRTIIPFTCSPNTCTAKTYGYKNEQTPSPTSGKSHPWLHISGAKYVEVEIFIAPPLSLATKLFVCLAPQPWILPFWLTGWRSR